MTVRALIIILCTVFCTSCGSTGDFTVGEVGVGADCTPTAVQFKLNVFEVVLGMDHILSNDIAAFRIELDL